jgi:hypothetical protein
VTHLPFFIFGPLGAVPAAMAGLTLARMSAAMVGLDSCRGVPASCTGVLSTDEMKGLAIGVRGSLVETFVVVGEPGTVPMLDPVAGMRDARVSPKEKGVTLLN